MQDAPNKPRQQTPPEPSQAPLWLVAVGLAIAVYSRGMKDEPVGNVVLWFGLAFSVVAFLYWVFRPKHGLGRRP